MNVAIIEPVCAYGGMDYYDYSLCKGLLKARQHIKLYTSDSGTLVPPNIEVVEVFKGVYGTNAKIVRAIKWFFALHKSLIDACSMKASIVHFHFFDAGPLQQLSVWYAKRRGLKTIATIHDVEWFHTDRGKRSISRLLYQLDGIIVHNEFSRSEVSRFLAEQPSNVVVIPHGHYLVVVIT